MVGRVYNNSLDIHHVGNTCEQLRPFPVANRVS